MLRAIVVAALLSPAVLASGESVAWENPGHQVVGKVADLILEQHPASVSGRIDIRKRQQRP